MQEWLQNISLQNLPVSTVKQLRKTLQDAVRNYIQEQGIDVLQGLSQSIDWDHISTWILKRLQNSSIMNTSLELVSQELALILERYLEQDLEKIMAQVIPILNIEQVIIDRVKETSPEDLEAAINGIVKSELQAIVNLGGILGVIIGLFQMLLLILR